MTQSLAARPRVELWTDGSTYPKNPGPHGGWAAILLSADGKRIRALSGYYKQATNQRSEAYAVLYGLKKLDRPCHVDVYTDSMYVIRCIEIMLHSQRSRRKKLPNANRDIWALFTDPLSRHTVVMHHVKGHSGVENNEWANKLAYEAATRRAGVDEYHEVVPELRKRRAAAAVCV